MKYATIVLAGALAACSNDGEVDARNASAEDVVKQVAESGVTENFVRPGK